MLLPTGEQRLRISWFSMLLFYVVLLAFTWLLAWGKFTTNVDQLIHDSWVRVSQRQAPDDVVIVGIDASSLDSLGRWPWPRNLQTVLFNRLADSDVQAAALDLLFVEPDSFSDNDVAMARAVSRLPIAVLPVLTEERENGRSVEKLPIVEVTRHVDGLGHIIMPIDSDGIVRRTFLKAGYNSAHWPALGLALAEALGSAPTEADMPGLDTTQIAGQGIWMRDKEALIPFYGPARTFQNVSALDVINGQVGADQLRDKIVLVGMTATGTGDMLPTAVSANDRPMPGVEIHANIFSTLRAGEMVTELDTALNYVVAGSLLLIMLILYSQLPPLWGMISASVVALVPVLLSLLLYIGFQRWYAPLGATIPVLFSYFLWSWHRLEFVAEFLRRQSSKLARDVRELDYADNQLLARFFDNAARHLPLRGWRFSASGQMYSGGIAPLPIRADAGVGRWIDNGTTHVKRYPTRGRLEIAFCADDAALSSELKNYIDSLSLVRERQRLTKMSGTLERLQTHTYQLSLQLDRLRHLNGLSESIFAGSPAGLVVWSASGEIVRVNALARQMLPNVSVQELSLHDFMRAIGREPEGRDHQHARELIQDRIPWQINRVTDDTELVVNFSAVGESLAERLISASIIDVTDIRKSERSRAELIDFMSHDLRAPLISAMYLLKDDSGNSVLNEDYASRIESNINHSLAMMDDLLTIARADNLTADAFSHTLFDLVVDNAIDQMWPQAKAKHIELAIETEVDDLWINADASLLERALVNIIGNAIKYSPENTTVTVTTSQREDHLVFQVQDQGVGIAPEMMGSLFQRFKRDSKIAREYKGIGLGLALVARVVSQHGGTVRAESPGEGTLIEMCLPLSADEPA